MIPCFGATLILAIALSLPMAVSWTLACTHLKLVKFSSTGNHEEESEIVFGDDTTHLTKCEFPGSDGSTPDCARAFVCAFTLGPLTTSCPVLVWMRPPLLTVAELRRARTLGLCRTFLQSVALSREHAAECCLPCRYRYPTPYVSAGSDSPFWYSVNAGAAHIIMVRLWYRRVHALSATLFSVASIATTQVRSVRRCLSCNLGVCCAVIDNTCASTLSQISAAGTLCC